MPLCSKIQKYSPTESAKVYDKAVNRKANVHFSPRQTLEFLSNNMYKADLSYETKRKIVRQYLDVSTFGLPAIVDAAGALWVSMAT